MIVLVVHEDTVLEIIKYLLAPFMLVQEKKIRKNIAPLAPPVGPYSGVHGQGTLLRVMVLGDSTGHSVGAESFDQALISQFLQYFPGYQIEWQVVATSGHDSEQALKQLIDTQANPIDVLITTLGVNDVTGTVPVKRWLETQRKIWDYARSELGAKFILVSGVMPIWKFPNLPQPIKGYLSMRAKRFDKALRAQVGNQQYAQYLSMEFSMELNCLGADGYHPGPKVYAHWAKKCADIIKAHPVMTCNRFIIEDQEIVTLQAKSKPTLNHKKQA